MQAILYSRMKPIMGMQKGEWIMQKYKAISLDMFQTLVNVNTRSIHVWKLILADDFIEEQARVHGSGLLQIVSRHLGTRQTEFRLMRDIFAASFQEYFSLQGIPYDCGKATEIMLREHAFCEMYEDTLPFLERIQGRCKVWIVSDADNVMIPEFHKQYGFTLMTSESFRSYKNDANNAMFHELLAQSDVRPEQILHIGDSAADVLGAKRAGLSACWMNRLNEPWTRDIAPDLIVGSLAELHDILE